MNEQGPTFVVVLGAVLFTAIVVGAGLLSWLHQVAGALSL